MSVVRDPKCATLVAALVWLLWGAPALGTEAAVADDAESARASYWVLTEFDWGDDAEVVWESVDFDPVFECRQRSRKGCSLVRVSVDGELLLARFHFDEGTLFQAEVLTPDLETAQAEQHLERVWKLLADYVTHHRGAPVAATELPELDSLSFGPPIQTHLWRAADLEARLRIGRRDEDLFYVGVYFSDPSRPEARKAHLAGMGAADEHFREQRAIQAAKLRRMKAGSDADAEPDED